MDEVAEAPKKVIRNLSSEEDSPGALTGSPGPSD